ncbi:hypothetical protein KCP76_26065 (plasmid) [Salmonella enterica subsp. enterica serovar Weltevreden]|nr:hypothetical protein KCP76_26065 [Salmonella enterica subsp. enterica serovar Weltevreden]
MISLSVRPSPAAQIPAFALLIFHSTRLRRAATTAASNVVSEENSAGVKVISVGMLQPIPADHIGLVGNQPQLCHKLQRPCGTGDGQVLPLF